MSSWWQSTKSWFRRHRTPILVTTGLITATYVGTQYVFSKIIEARARLADERVARENLRRRFTQNQEDCTYTVLALLPTAASNIMRDLPVEEIAEELQDRRKERLATSSSSVASSDIAALGSVGGQAPAPDGSYIHASRVEEESEAQPEAAEKQQQSSESREKKSKAQLWEKLKIDSLTRVITLMYTLSLLSLLTRVQLNLLGRRSYLSSVVSMATPAKNNSISLEDSSVDDFSSIPTTSDFEINRRYLTFSWWLLHRGWQTLKARVEAAVTSALVNETARDTVSFRKFSELIVEVRRSIEGETPEQRSQGNWLPYLLPEKHEENAVLQESGIGGVTDDSGEASAAVSGAYSLRRLLDETSDIIESPAFSNVLTLCLDSVFSLLVDEKIAPQAFKLPIQDFSTAASSSPTSELLASNPLVSGEARNETTTKLATILAVATRQAHFVGSAGNLSSFMAHSVSSSDGAPGFLPEGGAALKDANEYLAAIESVRNLEAFAAVVYSSNFELENLAAEVEAAENEIGELERNNPGESSFVNVGEELKQGLESAWAKATQSES